MKCPRCGYHNLPGAAACGQCGAGARAATAAAASGARVEEVYPPRARDRSLREQVSVGGRGRLRRSLALRTGRRPAGPTPTPTPTRALPRSPAAPWSDARPWLIATASLLPGLGQWLEGRQREAARLFGLACLLFIGLAATIRLPVSQALLALAFLLEWYSVWDAARHCFPSSLDDESARRLRLARLGFLSAGVVLSALVGGYALLARRYELLGINTDQYTPIFQRADELMIRRLDHPLARLRRGDVIIGSPDGADPVAWEARWVEDEGQPLPTRWIGPVIDRVIGLPGDRIDGAGAALWVNGVRLPPERMPLAPAAVSPFTAVVPRGCVAMWRPAGAAPGLEASGEPLLMLPEAGINGRVLAIDNPPARRRWVR